MSQILISNLSFSYTSFFDPIFTKVNLSLDTSWRLGLIGRNGKGKTTLLKLLMGELSHSGTIQAGTLFSYFPYPIEKQDEFTIDVARQIYPELEEWQLTKELNLLEVDPSAVWRSFETLSMGEQTKVMLAILFLMPQHFLLIDEPTNHLDMEARDVVAQYLKQKNGFILVSHDRYFLDQTVDHILSINNSNITLEQGNFSSWLINKQRQDQFEEKENMKLLGEIRQLDAAAKRTGMWSTKVENSKFGQGPVDRGYIGAKSAKMMKRSKAIEKRGNRATEEKSRLLNNIDRTFELQMHPVPYFKPILIRANHISFGYGDRCLVEDLSFTVEIGDKIAIVGANGSGKSTLMRLITGDLNPAEQNQDEDFWLKGNFERGSNMKISYMPQDTSYLQGDLKEFCIERQIDESLFKAILNKLDFPSLQFDKVLESFSAGQKKKVLLAASLSEEANLYLFDEPLNYIDVLSRMQIEQVLINYDPTLIMVEHDRNFVDLIATKVINLEPYLHQSEA